MPKVSAIVSTYNSAAFFRGCVEDLTAQTLYQQGELEIIVVNSGSKQDEDWHIRHLLNKGVRMVVITSQREPLYSAWNRAIKIATGAYLTNANTDDRHRPDALAVMADALDSQPETGLVYADCYVTGEANAVWGSDYRRSYAAPYTTGRLNWPAFDPQLLTQFCYVGNQPMWRASLHEKHGLFDGSYMVAGDYEFWLRLVAGGVSFARLPETLGIFYFDASQLGRAQADQSAMESRRAILEHRERILKRWQPSPT